MKITNGKFDELVLLFFGISATTLEYLDKVRHNIAKLRKAIIPKILNGQKNIRK